MPFGLCNAAQTFQRFINEVLQDLEFVYDYIDDILGGRRTASTTSADSFRSTKGIRRSNQSSKIHIRSIIGEILRTHRQRRRNTTTSGSSRSNSSVPTAQQHQRTQTLYRNDELLSKIHSASGISSTTAGGHGGNTQITWTEESRDAFTKMKEAIANATLLHHPKHDAPLSITVDASDFAIGDGTMWQPISFFTRALSSAEKKYSAYDRELLAIYSATAEVAIIRRFSGNSWGFSFKSMRRIYHGVFEGILSYAVPVWAHLLKQKTTRAAIIRGQRAALLLVTKAFRTVSTEALQVTAGVMPCDLMLMMRAEIYKAKHDKDNTRTIAEIKKTYVEEWQKQWNACPKGRHTYAIWPEIKKRLQQDVNVDFFLSQVYTGHGRFNRKLYDMNLVNIHSCAICGAPEDTLEHAIWTCPAITRLRQLHLGHVDDETLNLGNWLSNSATGKIFQRYAQEVMEQREKSGAYSRSAESRT
ncbi:UNVERIFIED_CONTAM: hypothetical protein PYX00_005693 [Menopon gallinae]|uniref:Reverse transcriptase/retrotransposon-derived protein RNase H-like domain-containing protein n=1 Tax=Menopon gallinae TaxID=328185 RepID=A0AAW2HSF1_9NEOP